jgi:hypothetical protein
VYGRLDFTVELHKKAENQSSCLLGHFVQELSETHPEFRSLCAERFRQWAEFFKQDLDAAKKKYAARRSMDTQSLAEHFIAILEGSLIVGRAKRDKKALGKSLWHFKQYLKTLFEG